MNEIKALTFAGEVQRVMMEPGKDGAHHLFARLLPQLQIRQPYPAMFEQACAI